ncbi:MAG TPA: AAA family ATPase, partial [Longimicrobiaceae bacterium]|nr:AAA family ATPase [Longimicrobiaceae bacterium]
MATPKKQARQVVRETRKELEAAPPAAYFLSLTVENIRSFGPAQTLDLSNGDGRPARWTVILGDNGVGKTTLLQSIALCEAFRGRTYLGADDDFRERLVWLPKSVLVFRMMRRSNIDETVSAGSPVQLTATLLHGTSFTIPDQGTVIDEWGVQDRFVPETEPQAPNVPGMMMTEDLSGLVCYGYGATRRMGVTSLSDAPQEENTATLFRDDVS